MKAINEYKGQTVIVLGLAKSGVAAAKVFHRIQAHVIVNDIKSLEHSPEAEQLQALGISIVSGHHPIGLVNTDTALVIKNPGIPYTVSPLIEAQQLGVEIVSEVEIAGQLSKAPIIGITGSNGKTTTTTLTGVLLEQAGFHPVVAGNIGSPLCEAALEVSQHNWLVAELSSFQLKGTSQFHPHIACLLNIVPTHLDYHGIFEDYVASKAKILSNLERDNIVVYNFDDPTCVDLVKDAKASLLPFSLLHPLPEGVMILPSYSIVALDRKDKDSQESKDKRWIVIRWKKKEIYLLPVDELSLPGRHNLANSLAAIAIALAAGADPDVLRQPLKDFSGVEHRLEFVTVNKGIKFYNDSKATNTVATMMSVLSFSSPVILIAGGLDRGMDYSELLPLFSCHIKGLVAIGETRKKLGKVAESAGLKQVKFVHPMDSAEEMIRIAAQEAKAMAQTGDIVLLSPACASWDMFRSFEERGRMFKSVAHTI